ncbi:hypothetical protein [Mesonia sp.]|uniref:hypothetical protein n=1 Tax=Mesonia sp. TaxID=1960830 RepID=UPI0017514A19|nr:hypothetical protein [Mesonia sp.]HIB36179.1 hypothetical protein [Mesonia sp.]HIO27992.1 hypothetical protein [Flavobacteriaceae bacterium]
MKEKKNIDRLFQEKFKDFEVSPDNHVWNNIADQLQEKKKKRVVPIWWYSLGGVAAILIAAIFIGNFFINNSNPKVVNTDQEEIIKPELRSQEQPFTNNDLQKKSNPINNIATSEDNKNNKANTQTPNPEKSNLQDVTNTNNSSLKANSNRVVKNTSSVEENSSINNRGIASTSSKKINSNTSSAENKTKLNKNSSLAYQENNESKNSVNRKNSIENSSAINNSTNSDLENSLAESTSVTKDTLSNNENKTANETLLAQQNEDEKTKSLVEVAKEIEEEKEENNEDEDENEPELSKWLIKPNVSPIYYGSLNGGNSIDQSLASNSTDSDITMAYGVNFAYTISEKLKVRSGISKVNMSYNVNNIAYAADVNAIRLEGVTNNSQTQIIEVSNALTNNFDVANPEFNRAFEVPQTNGVLNQQLGYLEVPLEVEYALLNKRFGINVIGGASTLFLDDNDIYIDSQNGHLSLGEANNLNKVSFTTNIGLGLGYQLSKKFDLNLEPTFKYQLNTYNNNINDFKPYYFGVYTGFSFKF